MNVVISRKNKDKNGRMIIPTADEVISANEKIIKLGKITKAEKHEMLASKERIEKAIKESCKGKDVYEDGARLLKAINQGHFFGSANKRTSYVVASNFIEENGGVVPKRSKGEEAKFMLEVRHGSVSVYEIVRWLHGKNR